MNCPTCQHENSSSDKFCSECGTSLIIRCASCDADLKPSAKFCSECGSPVAPAATTSVPSAKRVDQAVRAVADYTPKHLAEKILQSRSAVEGERKHVTVLFADVRGSMELASQLDPEDWHELLDRFFAVLTEGVHRYEGTVNQYTGDGVMALFGAPISHEDHAQRACYAALQMRDELRRLSVDCRMEKGIDFGVRMGINSGIVVVGKIGDDLRMDYTAQGHTVGVAQRLEQLAETGHVYLSEHTGRLVEGYFRLTDLGTSSIKGVDTPIGVFDLDAATNARTRLQVSRSRGLTQFVGRQGEMAALQAALARTREGHGQVVGIVGEPGLGKSRLCHEFVEQCRAQGMLIYEAHCPSYGQQIPFIPILQLFRSYFDISEQDTAAQARQKVAGMLLLLDPDMYNGLAVLFDFLGIADHDHPSEPIDVDVRQRQMFDLLHKITRVQNERGVASVIFIDDLHWIDTWSDEFVAQMVDATQASHILLLVNFRPEYQATWANKPYYQQMPLVPLNEDAVNEMLALLLGNDASVLTLSEKVMSWTGGNPLYTEEVINTLIETGQLEGSRGSYRLTRDVGSLQVPPSVQSIIAARIDRLSESDKILIGAAAVIGKTFSRHLVEIVADLPSKEFTPTIEGLKSADFIYETSLYPTIEYSFKHPLVHEVAYGSQLRDKRIQIHEAAALAIEKLEEARLDEFSSMLAYHWEHAKRSDQALLWHQRAAVILGMSDPRAALNHWGKVRDFVDKVEQSNEVLVAGAKACGEMMHLQWRLSTTKDAAHELFQEGKEFADRAGDIAAKAVLTASYGALRGISGGYCDDYREYGRQAAEIAKETNDLELQLSMQSWHAWGSLFSGRLTDSLAIADSILGKAPADPEFGRAYMPGSLLWAVHAFRGASLCLIGDRFQGFNEFDESLRRAEQRSEAMGYTAPLASILSSYLGDFSRARSVASSSLEIQGHDAAMVATNVAMAVHQHFLGDLDEAYRYAEAGLEGVDRASYHPVRAIAAGVLADAKIALGDAANALELAQKTIDFCAPKELLWFLSPWLSRAQAYVVLGERERSRATLIEVQSMIDESGAKVFQPYLHERQAHYAELFADGWSKADEIRHAHRLFVEMGATDHVTRVLRAHPDILT